MRFDSDRADVDTRRLSEKETISAVTLLAVSGPLETKRLDTTLAACNVYYMPINPQQPITEALRQAIAESGVSFAALERETGVKRQSLMKFARGEQSLRLDLADRLAAFFGL